MSHELSRKGWTISIAQEVGEKRTAVSGAVIMISRYDQPLSAPSVSSGSSGSPADSSPSVTSQSQKTAVARTDLLVGDGLAVEAPGQQVLQGEPGSAE